VLIGVNDRVKAVSIVGKSVKSVKSKNPANQLLALYSGYSGGGTTAYVLVYAQLLYSLFAFTDHGWESKWVSGLYFS
jgi:hypothetical protein